MRERISFGFERYENQSVFFPLRRFEIALLVYASLTRIDRKAVSSKIPQAMFTRNLHQDPEYHVCDAGQLLEAHIFEAVQAAEEVRWFGCRMILKEVGIQ